MNQTIYKTLFLLLILSLFKASIEISFLVALACLMLSYKSKIHSKLYAVILPLLLVYLIGIFGILTTENPIKIYLKDLIYFSRPVLVIFASYSLIYRIKNKTFLFSSIIILGFIFSFIHLIKLGINITKLTDTSTIRFIGGRYNHIELIALVFLITPYRTSVKKYFDVITYRFLVFLLIISFVFYLSRVMVVSFILFFLAYKGYLRFTKKGIKKMFIAGLILIILITFINKLNVNSYSKGLGGFVFKIQNTYNEMFESLDIEKIKKDRRDLWEHWRGYEAQTAIEMLNKKGTKSWVFGRGFGSLVDLGIEVNLDNEQTRYIPILHNGLVYVLFKTGLLGLFFYMYYIWIVYSSFKYSSTTKVEFTLNRLIIGVAFYIAISSLVITGIFKPYDMSSLLIGGLFALKIYDNENSNIRD